MVRRCKEYPVDVLVPKYEYSTAEYLDCFGLYVDFLGYEVVRPCCVYDLIEPREWAMLTTTTCKEF